MFFLLFQAKSLLLELIKDNPRKSEYYNTLGCVYEAAGEAPKALEVRIEAAKLSGAKFEEWMQLGLLARWDIIYLNICVYVCVSGFYTPKMLGIFLGTHDC